MYLLWHRILSLPDSDRPHFRNGVLRSQPEDLAYVDSCFLDARQIAFDCLGAQGPYCPYLHLKPFSNPLRLTHYWLTVAVSVLRLSGGLAVSTGVMKPGGSGTVTVVEPTDSGLKFRVVEELPAAMA